MSKQRPVNLKISTISLPLPAYASILHRIAGVLIFLGMAVLLWMLSESLTSEEGFHHVKDCLQSLTGKIIIWFILSGFIYHLVAGIKHLMLDCGIGETLEGGRTAAVICLVLASLLIVLAAIWLW